MKLTLKIWRQTGRKDKGKLRQLRGGRCESGHVDAGVLDVLNETLIENGEEPVRLSTTAARASADRADS